eukprot:gene7051-14350_t
MISRFNIFRNFSILKGSVPVRLLSSKAPDKNVASTVIKNEQITSKSVRVVYKDPTTNKGEWKILQRKEAIAFAKGMGLDLVLVDIKADPPVCKLENYGNVISELRKKEKLRTNDKPKGMKEMFVGALIDPHDLDIKLNKVRQFLDEGHPVKVSVLAKKRMLHAHPQALETATERLFIALGEYGQSVQRKYYSVFKNEFTLNPRPTEKPTAATRIP